MRSRHNNLNLIRLVAATSVAFAHSFALLNATAPWEGFATSGAFGFVAVAVFFGLSGFLITKSFEARKSSYEFLAARWLRIFPGLFFSCFVTTVLISQFVKHQGFEAFLDIKNWRYTFGAFFFDYSYYDGVFDSNPNRGVNGSLWTLPVEFRLYLFVFVFGLIGILKKRFLFLAIAIGLLACGIFEIEFVTEKIYRLLFRVQIPSYLPLPLCFVCGMLFYLFRERIVLSIPLSLLLLASNLFVAHWSLLGLSFVYAAFVFGYHPSLYLPKLEFKTDISYGIYVLAFPIQQVLIFNGIIVESHLFFVLTMLCTVPLALISWHFVELPALNLRGYFFQRRGAIAPS